MDYAAPSLTGLRVARAGVHTTRAVGGSHTGSSKVIASVAGAIGVSYGLLGLLVSLFATAPYEEAKRQP